MKNVSESFKNKIKQPSRTFSAHIKIGSQKFDDTNIETFRIVSSVGNSDMPSIGAFVADNLEMTLINNGDYTFSNDAPMLVYATLEGEPELCLGKFYVNSNDVERKKHTVEVNAFGIAVKLAETEYITDLEFPCAVSAIASELETRYNLEFMNKAVIPDIEYKSKPAGTVRAMISEIAQLCGANVRERFEKLNVHQLEFVFTSNTFETFTSDNYIDFARLSDKPISFTKLFVEKNDVAVVDGEEIKADDLAYGDDTGYAIKIANEHIEGEAELAALYDKIFPFTFTPFECILQGMPHIEAGDNISIKELLSRNAVTTISKLYRLVFNDIGDVGSLTIGNVKDPTEVVLNSYSYTPATIGVDTDELQEATWNLTIISHTLEYNGGFKSTFTSACPDESMLVVGSNGVRMEDIIKRTERTISALRVDNDRITMMVAELDGDITTMGTLYEQTAEQIQLTAERVEGMQAQFTLTADEINARVQDAEQGMSEISQTATEITHRVESAEQGISEIRQSVAEIDLSVDGDELVARINLSPDGVKIDGKNLDLNGLVTFTNLEEEGETVINAGNITTGFVSADRIQGGQFKATTDSESFLEITENGIKIQGEANEAILDETNITELSARKFFEIDGRETGLNAWSGKWGIVLQGQAGTHPSSGGLALGSKDNYGMLKLYPDSYENEQRAGKAVFEPPTIFVGKAYETSQTDEHKYITKAEMVAELEKWELSGGGDGGGDGGGSGGETDDDDYLSLSALEEHITKKYTVITASILNHYYFHPLFIERHLPVNRKYYEGEWNLESVIVSILTVVGGHIPNYFLANCVDVEFVESESPTSVQLSNYGILPKAIGTTIVKTVGEGAFKNCKKLKGFINLFKTVTHISLEAFYGCESLTRAWFDGSDDVYIGSRAFYGCKSLESFYIGSDGYQRVLFGSDVFYGCTSLKYVYLGKSVPSPETFTGITNCRYSFNFSLRDEEEINAVSGLRAFLDFAEATGSTVYFNGYLYTKPTN